MILKSRQRHFGSLIILVLLVLFGEVFSPAYAEYIITTVAGNGTWGFSGDGGSATNAQLKYPVDVAVDNSGNIYIAENHNQRIRKVATNGIITTVAGSGVPDPDNYGIIRGGFSGDGGPAANAQFSSIEGIAIDSSGNLYIVDSNNQRIRKISVSTGIITTVAGSGVPDTDNYGIIRGGFRGDGGPATSAQLNLPYAVAVDISGNLYIVDKDNNRIRKVDTAGIISTVAGNGTAGFSGDGGPAAAAQLNTPYGVAVDSTGNLYIADQYNQRIRKVSTNGIITTVAGSGALEIDVYGRGYVRGGFSGDGGSATNAQLNTPLDVTVDNIGNLYISEYYNHRIRKIDTNGIISTFAGSGAVNASYGGFSGDGGPATSAQLNIPWGVSFDSNGNFYIADMINARIRKVAFVTTTRIINISLSNLAFGDVIVNRTKQLTLTIKNTGNSTLTVNSIDYPSGFSGSWSGTIDAGGSQNVTVTFSPTTVQAYTGTVTVNSDKTAGLNTVAISGNGIADPCQCTDTNGSTQDGIDLVKANPGDYQLFNQTQLNQKIADAVKAEQLKWDANGDGKIGLEDIISMLQVIAGLRP